MEMPFNRHAGSVPRANQMCFIFRLVHGPPLMRLIDSIYAFSFSNLRAFYLHFSEGMVEIPRTLRIALV
jgi:hypothetical protein